MSAPTNADQRVALAVRLRTLADRELRQSVAGFVTNMTQTAFEAAGLEESAAMGRRRAEQIALRLLLAPDDLDVLAEEWRALLRQMALTLDVSAVPTDRHE